ncbi:MAG: restriction endonuclease subunit S [Planctomycetes bacterium]|nr:restriction endonuclease subunit S [Planctomycetota bacterium]
MATSQDFVDWICSEAIAPEFLMRLFMAEKDSLLRFGVGTTHKTIYFPEVKAFRVCVPPPPEQRRIVEKIEALNERSSAARTSLEQIPVLLGRFRQSVLAAAFRGDLTANWRAQNPDVEPASVLLERIRAERRRRWEEDYFAKQRAKGKEPKNDEWKAKYREPEPVDSSKLAELPETWAWISIAELARGESYSLAIGPFGSNLKVADYRNSGVPLVFVRNIRAESFEPSAKTRYVTEEKADSLVAHAIEPGDLLITKMGDPPGDTSVYPLGSPRAIITADCIKLRVECSLSSPNFLRLWLRAQPVKTQILGETRGVAQRKLSLKRFRTILVALPPLEEQDEIAGQLEAQFAAARQAEDRTTAGTDCLERLDQSILAKAFRGELVPQDPDDEPASVLLERIRAEREAAAPKKKTSAKKPKKSKKAASR